MVDIDNAPFHPRRSIRLQGWDYSSSATYFVTLCAIDRACLFGEIHDRAMRLNHIGIKVHEAWQWLASHYTHVILDEYCVMPNHLHAIVTLKGPSDSIDPDPHSEAGGSRTAPPGQRRKPLGRLIGAFKTVSTKHINNLRGTAGAIVWQRDFWERIVREVGEIDALRDYIRDNPAQWTSDSLHR